ncbi:ADP-ribosylglycohydrolase family protein [Archangium primigenium]|uniref:ADP-ribosylglycohydrolase family protein n=1 Tax=[Archangium] primigenium TaxID=2792470 RepID=UPI00195B4BA0|nr:ADP-ribosylglycohydrolase family protein [Archangium primigenium]MBM7118912.1 ADP-ribosylglycohydrolase family protein [Archangium primigenium]
MRADAFEGALLGTVVGDALGLPREGLSHRRALRMFGPAPLHHRFLLGRGVGSDDTEHACMVGQALLAAPEAPERFARSLAWRLRGWLLGLPAGVGWATLRATVKLWLGFSPQHSGVVSAGNGPAMRAPLLGVCFAEQPERLAAFVRASSRLTHRDARAEQGALAVALAAAHGARRGPAGVDAEEVMREWAAHVDEPLLREAFACLRAAWERGASVAAFAEDLGLGDGVSGYVLHTVPVVLYAWLRHATDFRRAVEETILLGGDSDTTGAIVGALMGATLGPGAIPAEWLAPIAEWPRSVAWMRRLGGRLAARFAGPATDTSPGALPLFWPALVPRNLLVLVVVLGHGFRRLLPPY